MPSRVRVCRGPPGRVSKRQRRIRATRCVTHLPQDDENPFLTAPVMPTSSTFRIAALATIERLFRDIHSLPWVVDSRAGVVRISGEPIVIPRNWLARDPGGRCIEQALRDAWDDATLQPIRRQANNCGEFTLRCWSTEICIADMLGWVSASMEHWPVDPPWDNTYDFPDLWAMLPELLNVTLLDTFSRFGAAPEEAQNDGPVVDEFFVDDLAIALAHEIQTRIDRQTLLESLQVLSMATDGVSDHVLQRIPKTSTLYQAAISIQKASEHAQQLWPDRDRHLAPFLPLACLTFESPSPEEIRAWLLANGMSPKNLKRMHHLPLATRDALLADWNYNVRSDWRTPVAWLDLLITELHANRRNNLEDSVLSDLGIIAGAAGVLRATIPGSEAAPQVGDAVSPANEIEGLSATVTLCISRLAGSDLRVAGMFARTLIRELARATPARLEHIVEHIDTVRDWLTGNHYLIVEADSIGVEDVGPDWETLMLGQRRWHAQWEPFIHQFTARRRAAELPEQLVTWSSPCDGFTVGEFEIVPLVSNEDLREEGRDLQHCVSTYWPRCVDGKCLLFSVRHIADNARLGTVEFNPRDDGWKLVQFRGRRNAQLLAKAGEAIEPYTALIHALEERLNAAMPMRRAG